MGFRPLIQPCLRGGYLPPSATPPPLVEFELPSGYPLETTRELAIVLEDMRLEVRQAFIDAGEDWDGPGGFGDKIKVQTTRSHGFTGMFCPESLCTRLPQLSSGSQTYLPLSFPLSAGAWAQDLTKAPLNKKALLQHRAPSLGADPASQTAEQRAELDDFEKGQLLDDVSVRSIWTVGTWPHSVRLSANG